MPAPEPTRTTCPYCGVGCGIVARGEGTHLIAVEGDAAHPANRGELCVKGSTLAETHRRAGRLLRPEVDGAVVSWDTALDRVANGFAETIAEHGPDSVAFYLSGQLLTEDYYVANKLMKGFLGSANVDTNSRLCMASAVAAHKRAFGEDVVPCDYEDVDTADLLVLVGSNAAWAHPVLYRRIAARRAAGARVVVIDPRRTATCEVADLHLQIAPGGDAPLFNALLVWLEERDALDEGYVSAHTSGLDEALAAARPDAMDVARRTGLAIDEILTFFEWFAATPATLTLFSQGVNQARDGTDRANAIVNCHLATGRIGRAGRGPFSITGQPNAMGGREVGGLANQLAAHLDFDPAAVDAVGAFWNAPAMARSPGLKAVELFEAVAQGRIRALWIMGTNPAVSLPDTRRVVAALQACPLVVVSDCVADTETGRLAHVRLPARGWGEKNGTVTNSERCLSRQRASVAPVGEARSDWRIVCDVAQRLGFADAFAFDSPAAVFREHAALTGIASACGRTLDLSALASLDDGSYASLEPVRWPLDGRRPFEGGRFPTPDGRARIVAVTSRPPADVEADAFVLNSGRLRDQWHTMTRTGNAPRLFGHTPHPELALAPEDATRVGVEAGELVEVENARGRLRAPARIEAGQRAGEVFAPIHWNGAYAWPTRVGDLYAPVVDPVSGQPASKRTEVRVRPATVSGWVRIVGERAAAAPASAGLAYRSEVPLRRGTAQEFAFADAEAFEAALTRWAPAEGEALAFVDEDALERRVLRIVRGRVVAVIAAASRRADLLPVRTCEALLGAADTPNAPLWQRVTGLAESVRDGSPLVCTCMEVREAAIVACVRAGAGTSRALGEALGCGTACGSCIPELQTLLEGERRRGAA